MTIEPSTEQLENGSRATTPAGDNLLRDFAYAEARAFAEIAIAGGGRAAHDDSSGLAMSDTSSPCPFGNIAHLRRPIESSEAVDVVDALQTFFAQGSGGPFLLFSPWPTPDLSPAGLHLGGHPPMMVRPAGPTDELATGLRVERVTDSVQLEDFERTLVDAYPTPELAPFGSQPRLIRDGVLASHWTMYVGYEGDRPVATSGAYVTDQLVAVEMVSTRTECRGRGYGAAITAAAATAAPDRPSVLVASDLGRGVYERLGYMPILRYTLWMGQRR